MIKLNKMPIAAAVVAIGLVLLQSGFMPKVQAPNYVKYSGPGSVNGWIPTSVLPASRYDCKLSQDICRAYFSSPPASPNAQPTSGIQNGTANLK